MIQISNQRKYLQKYLNQTLRFRAIFSEIRHDKDNIPQILLLDVYPIYSNGNKKPIRKYGVKNRQGIIVAADHVWIKLNQNVLNLNTELKHGDVIDFDATVIEYPIIRDDVIENRKQAYNSAAQENDVLYQDYKEAKNILYKRTVAECNRIYNSTNLIYNEKRRAQDDLWKNFKKISHEMYHKMQVLQNREKRKANRRIESNELVDYGLANIANIEIHKLVKASDRIKYDNFRLNDLKYTKFLAARSMEFKKVGTK